MIPLSISKIQKEITQGITIDLLNNLVKTNNDRLLGYKTASTETDEQELHSTFAEFALSSQLCRQELINEIISLGGKPTDRAKISGIIFRAWMDIKATLTGRDLGPIIDSCESLEETAIGTYRKALRIGTGLLSTEQLAMITAHISLLKSDHNRLAFMRNVMVIAE